MKTIISITAIVFLIASCNEQKVDTEKPINKIIDNTKHDIDSINERFDFLIKMKELGVDEARANKLYDSTYAEVYQYDKLIKKP